MLYGKQIASDYFRNYVPYAPNFEVEALSAKPVLIPLREWILQGARDIETHESPDPVVLSRLPVQRGWRMRPLVKELPLNGIVKWDANQCAFEYTSNIGYQGEDCFTYVFTNGYQQSIMAKVVITIERTYDVTIEGIEESEDGNYSIRLQPYIPGGSSHPLFIHYDWYYQNYQDARVRDDGEIGVFTTDKKFYGTIYRSDVLTNDYPTVIPSYNPPPHYYPDLRRGEDLIDFTPETDSGIRGFIGNSSVPYRPSEQIYRIYIIVKFYFNHIKKKVFAGYSRGVPVYNYVNDGLDFSKFTQVRVDLSDYYGARWWQSGNIKRPYLQTHDPDSETESDNQG